MNGWRALAMAPLMALLVVTPVLAQDEAPPPRRVLPDECQAEPRTFEEISALLALDGEGIPAPAVTVLSPPLGELADAATATAIADAARQVIACFNAGDIPRATGLMTDNGVQRVYWGLAADEENRALARERIPAAPEPRDEAFLARLLAVTDVSMLPEGRVAAFVVISEPLLPPGGPETLLFIFANQDGQWLLDDLVDFTVTPVITTEEAS